MRGDTQAQNDGGRDGASPKGQHAWGKGSEGQAVVHRARRDWQGSPGAGNLHSAQIDPGIISCGTELPIHLGPLTTRLLSGRERILHLL